MLICTDRWRHRPKLSPYRRYAETQHKRNFPALPELAKVGCKCVFPISFFVIQTLSNRLTTRTASSWSFKYMRGSIAMRHSLVGNQDGVITAHRILHHINSWLRSTVFTNGLTSLRQTKSGYRSKRKRLTCRYQHVEPGTKYSR